ncbi:hypothetical protein AB0I60_15390 [Actinosynnema sp. NPDC050436]|uniref:hypothetical protein n=1 Tax=Actinosynnema sp. NPDC050436 TaxID=3155659 RepID=UPI0033C3BA86
MTGLAGLAATAALLAGAGPVSAAAPGDASAHGARVALSLLDGVAALAGPFAADVSGPADIPAVGGTSSAVAAVDAGGLTDSTVAGIAVPDLVATGVITTSAARDDDAGTRSRAVVADVRLDLLSSVTGGISATTAEATCSAGREGVGGAAELVGLDLGRLGGPTARPAPNTVVDVGPPGAAIARVVLNEQVAGPDGGLTVNAVHLVLLGGVLGSIGTGDVVLASATCGPAGPPLPTASGAGLWLGIAMIALFAVPVVVVGLRRRREVPAS